MSQPIAPGDWVECVRASTTHGFRPGQIYRCTSTPPTVLPCNTCGKKHTGIQLAGAPAQRPATWLWPICCFRPIYRPKSELIEQLKQPVDIGSDEPVSVTA